MGSRRAELISFHDRIHTVSQSRAALGLPATASAVSSSVSLRQDTVLCLKGSSGHEPTVLGVALTPRTLYQMLQKGKAPQEPQCSEVWGRKSTPASSWLCLSSPALNHTLVPSHVPEVTAKANTGWTLVDM